MRTVSALNDGWSFRPGFDPAAVGVAQGGAAVSLPHNAVDLPFSYLDETAYQHAFTYQRVIPWQDDFAGHEVAVVFDGAMA
ncbi:hypothetical protein J8J40_27795, partial [Mycobacterium tuberculosis]|nr:hypothetical protein [Mycobacterium tuberculosis]MBP0650857.1 hypothetical protein [Mycobacterium tuberculosis]